MFMGEYHHNLDDKSRLVIPANFREELGTKFVIAHGIEKCLYVYSQEKWQQVVKKLENLPFTKKDARAFMRVFFSGATECEIDRSGRICISSPFVSYANIQKECVIIGANDRLEIWSQANWNETLKDNEDKLSDIAENLFTGDTYGSL
jgi:MraZ protein